MESFLFSLNATIPVFIVILLGYFLKIRGKVNDNFCNVANEINYKITLPALLFKDISSTNIKETFDLKYIVFCAVVTTICFFTIWALSKVFVKDKLEVGAFVQGSFRGSAAVLGIAFIQNVYGDAGMAPLMIIGAVPLYNIYSVLVLTFEGKDNDSKNIKNAFLNICKNPIIISIIIGVIVSYLDFEFPLIVDKSIGSVAQLATPLALLVIGAGFEGKKAIAKLKITTVGTIIKLIIQPALFLPVAIAMGFAGDKMIAILIMLGSPTTASCYIMAKSMNNDTVLTSSMVVMSTLFSSITLTVWIYVLKSIGVL